MSKSTSCIHFPQPLYKFVASTCQLRAVDTPERFCHNLSKADNFLNEVCSYIFGSFTCYGILDTISFPTGVFSGDGSKIFLSV